MTKEQRWEFARNLQAESHRVGMDFNDLSIEIKRRGERWKISRDRLSALYFGKTAPPVTESEITTIANALGVPEQRIAITREALERELAELRSLRGA